MNNNPQRKASQTAIRPVPAGADEFGEVRSLGISTIAFKVVPQDPALWQAHGMELLGPPLPV